MKKNFSRTPMVGFILPFESFGEVYPLIAIVKNILLLSVYSKT